MLTTSSNRVAAKRLLAIGLILLLFNGCVRRRLTVRTNQPGASVYVDRQFIGTSPASTSVTYYGTREIEVVGDGYRTERVLRTFNPPWYQIPPLDFISETLWPGELRDERIVDITMVPSQQMPQEVLQARADELRIQASQGLATPLPPTINPDSGFAEPGVYPEGQFGTVLPPSGVYPPGALDPYGPADPGSTLIPPIVNSPSSTWQPGQIVQEFVAPGGVPPTSIPEAGILRGGGYRPELPSTTGQ